MVKMLGSLIRPYCTHCRDYSGPDCIDRGRGRGAQRAHEKRSWKLDQDFTYDPEGDDMSVSEKLHEFISKIRGGSEVVHRDVEEIVQTVTEHLSSTLIPAVKANVKDLLASIDDDIKKAVSDALAFERAEAQKIVEELSATYQKLAEAHGQDMADQLLVDAHAAAQVVAEAPAS